MFIGIYKLLASTDAAGESPRTASGRRSSGKEIVAKPGKQEQGITHPGEQAECHLRRRVMHLPVLDSAILKSCSL